MRKQRCRFCRCEIVGWKPGDPTFCGSCYLDHKDRVAKRNASAGPVPSLLPAPDIEFEAFRESLQAKVLRGEPLTLEEKEKMATLATLRALAGRRPGTVMRAAEQLMEGKSLAQRQAERAESEEGKTPRPSPKSYGL